MQVERFWTYPEEINGDILKKFVWPMVAVAIAGGSYLGSFAVNHNVASAESPVATAKPTPTPTHDISTAEDLSRNFREVHNALKDAVVNISVSKKEASAHTRLRLPPGFQLLPGLAERYAAG